jgi:hypothetical protein
VSHRSRLRSFEIVDGVVYIDVATELISSDTPGAGPVAFIRDERGVRLADPRCLPDGMRRSPSGVYEVNVDLAPALRRSAIWFLLRERRTELERLFPAATMVEATPDLRLSRARQFAVRFGATAVFDVLPAAEDTIASGMWDMFSVLDALGARTIAPLGPHRDRGLVDSHLVPCEVGGRARIAPSLTGFGPRLTLNITPASLSDV